MNSDSATPLPASNHPPPVIPPADAHQVHAHAPDEDDSLVIDLKPESESVSSPSSTPAPARLPAGPSPQRAPGQRTSADGVLLSGVEGSAKEGVGSGASPGAGTGGSEEEEKEFEPTVEMMMNDFDDERTLEEEEALQEDNETDTAAEVEALELEGDMPLGDLLKMYGYKAGAEDEPSDSETKDSPTASPAKDEDEDGEEEEEEEEDALAATTSSPKAGDKRSNSDEDKSEDVKSGAKRGSMSPPPPAKKSKSELARFYYEDQQGRSLRSSAMGGGGGSGSCSLSGAPGEDEEEDSDGGGLGGGNGDESDMEGRDYSWKKTIMIGPSFQASVPSDMSKYDDTLPYENEDKLLWDPKLLTRQEVEQYLSRSQDSLNQSGVASLPMGDHIRDDEQALHLLLQCGYNYEEALRRRRMNPLSPAETMSLWSEEECRAFELGLRLYGKDFHMIQQQKVRTRSVGELVQFYYLWKKTERHDVFANATRLEKKKYTLHPGTTDYMDRFIDEQEQSHPHPSPNYHSLLYGTDGKRGISINTPSGHHHSMLKPTEAAINGSAPPITSSHTPNASNGSVLSSSSTTNGSSGLSVQNMIAFPENPPSSNNSSSSMNLSMSTPTLAVAPNTTDHHHIHHPPPTMD
ncbi:mesoderm induction early response protein 1-like [Tigriopus californicus]|uniref:mesoderm induction early response protein 1-like n=1 Tax=Tigriopus californicus TaxID=6832 RepID=UPI0027DA6334|nr:mesoderm induction early response protein 1-like [Tigriopus californicus]